MFLGKTLKYSLAVLSVMLLTISVSRAGDVDIKTLEVSAFSGSASDAKKLGDFYSNREDYKNAEKWYRIAVFNGGAESALAIYSLGKHGNIEAKDLDTMKNLGLYRLEKEAETSAKSAFKLSEIYGEDEIVAKDPVKEKLWFDRVILLDSSSIASTLGKKYNYGFGAPVNAERAFYYHSKAVEKGSTYDMRQVAAAYASGIGVTKDIAKAKKYYLKAAELGDNLAMRDLANYYVLHENNKSESLKWFKRAADAGNVDALYYLGMNYKNTDIEKARKYFESAAKKLHLASRVELENMK